MKKYLILLLLGLGLVLQLEFSPTASAQDYWCYTDNAGYEYYVIAEKSEYLLGGKYIGHVKKISPQKTMVSELEWLFAFDEGECWAACRTDTRLSPKEGKVRNSPLALSIIRFLYHHKYGNKYNQYID